MSPQGCLEEGVEVVAFEAGNDGVGGFWRFREDGVSVYESTHIDTDRDLNSFGDYPYDPSAPVCT